MDCIIRHSNCKKSQKSVHSSLDWKLPLIKMIILILRFMLVKTWKYWFQIRYVFKVDPFSLQLAVSTFSGSYKVGLVAAKSVRSWCLLNTTLHLFGPYLTRKKSVRIPKRSSAFFIYAAYDAHEMHQIYGTP